MSVPLFVLGTGGHAREVADIAAALGWCPVLVTNDLAARIGSSVSDKIAVESEAIRQLDAAFAVGIGDNVARERVANRYPDLHFPTLIHPDATLDRRQRDAVASARGTVVFAGVRFTAGTTVGSFCTFNLNATISHDCEIDDFANISPGANIAGNVHVGRGAWVGIGAAINQGSAERKLKIGAEAVIGSGAVVLEDCAPKGVYVGVPARRLR